MGRVVLLLLLVATAISKDIFEPADLDKIFKSEGKDSATEKKDEQKAKAGGKDKQYIGFQYSNESTTTCFINPQTSEKKEQKAQLSYVVSLSSLLSKASAAPTSTSTQTSSASAQNKSSSVLSSASASVLGGASTAKRTASASTRKTKERSEKTKTTSRTSSVSASTTSGDGKKPVSAHIAAAAGKHREEEPGAQKGKQEKKEPGKGHYWTTVMAYGSPEKVLIGVKTITIIESIIREPAISGAAVSIVKTALGEKGDVRSRETVKVGDIVVPARGAGGSQHQDVGDIAKHTSEASGKTSRPEIAAEMPAQTKKEKSSKTKSGAMSQSSTFSSKHTASADGAMEKLTIAIPVQMSRSTSPASQTTKSRQRKKGDGVETKTAHSTRSGKEEKSTASKALASIFSSGPASSDSSSESTSSSSETAHTEKEKSTSTTPKSSVTVVVVKHLETRTSSPAVSSSTASGPNISSIQHSLSQINEKFLKSISSSLASATSTKKEEREHKKATVTLSASTARHTVHTAGRDLSKQASGTESRTQKSAKGKASQTSTATSTTTKKRKEGFGGLGIWKRIGDFSNDGEESTKDTTERSAHVSSTAVKSAGEKKESSAERGKKSDSIVDILTALNGASKKKGENTKVFIDGDFQAKKDDKKIGSKLKFKGWISGGSNE